MPFSRVHDLVGVIVVEDDDAFGAEHFDSRGVAERRVFLRQRVAHTEIHDGAVVVREDRVAHVGDFVPGLLEHAHLAPRIDFREPPVVEEPAHQVDVIGQRVDDRRRVRIAREHRERLRARVENTRRAADRLADAALHDLLFRDQVAVLVAPAVAHAHVGAGFLDRLDQRGRRRRASARAVFRRARAFPARSLSASARRARLRSSRRSPRSTSGCEMTSSLSVL